MEWKQDPVVWLAAITAAATSVMAWFGVKTFRLQRKAALVEAPTMVSWLSVEPKSKEATLNFAVTPPDSEKWRVKSVTAWPPWSRLIAGHNGRRVTDEGRWTADRTEWTRRVVYEFPPTKDFVFLHPKCSGTISIVFELSLLAAPKVTSRFATRYKIKETER